MAPNYHSRTVQFCPVLCSTVTAAVHCTIQYSTAIVFHWAFVYRSVHVVFRFHASCLILRRRLLLLSNLIMRLKSHPLMRCLPLEVPNHFATFAFTTHSGKPVGLFVFGASVCRRRTNSSLLRSIRFHSNSIRFVSFRFISSLFILFHSTRFIVSQLAYSTLIYTRSVQSLLEFCAILLPVGPTFSGLRFLCVLTCIIFGSGFNAGDTIGSYYLTWHMKWNDMTHRECRLLWPQFLAESFSYRTHNLRASTVQCPYIVYSTRSERLGAARSGAADSRSMNPARHRIVSHCNEQSCVWCLLCYVLGFCLPHVLCVSFVADSHWSATFSRWTISCLQLQYSASQMHSLISRFAFKFVLSSRVESSLCLRARMEI